MKTKLIALGLFSTLLLFIPLLILPTHAQGPDLTLNKTVELSNDPAQPGDAITYTIVVSNSSITDATNVRITDTLPIEVEGTALDVTTTVTANESLTFTLNATITTGITSGTTITNTAYYSTATSSDQASVAFTIATTPTTATFEILDPTTLNPTFAGSITSPQKIIVHVTKPEAGLTIDKFEVTIGGLPATIVTLYEGTNEYVLEVLPPAQPANGLYDLSVSATTSATVESATELDAVNYSDTNNIDVMLVIDRSGSMTFEDNIEKAKNAAKQFVDLMMDDDKIGVVSFSSVATLNYTLTTVISDTKTEAKAAIDPLTADGFTSIGGGLEIAQDQLTTSGDAAHPWAIVLMSDGLENRPPFVADVLPGIQSTKTVVHTIALGSLADKLLMLNIAAETDGTYNFAPTGQELAGVYNTISAALTGQQTLIFLNGVVDVGATDEKTVVIDSTLDQATFSVSWSSGSSLQLTLEDPSGNLIDPAVAGSNPDVDYVEGPTYQYYRVVSPTLVVGSWKMKVENGSFTISSQAVASAASGTPYTVQVLGDSDLDLHTYIDQPNFQPGDDIKVSITLADDQPISGAQVVAVAGPFIRVNPSTLGSSTLPNPVLVLYDDGQHDDGQANDGVYANTLPGSETGNQGTYSFSVFANGTSNQGETFARESRMSVLVGVDAAPFLLSDNPNFSYLPIIRK